MAEPQRSASAPRWPSPTASRPSSPQQRSPSSPLKSTTPSSGSQSSPQKSPNTIMQELIKKAKDLARNKQPQQPTLQELINQSNTDTQFHEKLITNPKNLHHFKTQYIIGSSGGASTVCSGVYWVNDAQELDKMEHYDIFVAVKVTNMEEQEEYEKLVQQINKTSQLDHHPNLLHVKEEMVVEDKFWVVFPLMNGSLRCLLKSVYSTNGVPKDLVAIVLKEVLEALAYLHQQGHLHQELNASHIYYNMSIPAIKIGYLATIYEHNSGGDGEALPESLPVSEICEWAAAPEIYHLREEYTDKSDVWLVGITALELALGGIQVKNREELELLIAEVTSKEEGYKGKWKRKKRAVGKYFKKMMRKMKIGKSGSSSRSMRNDGTLWRSFKDMLALCLTEDAGERPTAAALLQHDFFKICDGVFDVYDFRNAVESAISEIRMSVATSSGSNAAGTSTGGNAAGTSTGGNAAGASSGGNAAGTSSGGNAAGTSTGGNAAGTSGSNAADTSTGSNVAEGAKP